MRRKTPCFRYVDIRRPPSGEFFLFSQNTLDKIVISNVLDYTILGDSS
jgi:hypothetical protein